MHPGIHYQPNGAKTFTCELPETTRRLTVQTQFCAERLHIKRPTFYVSAVHVKPAKLGNVREALRQGDLKDMPRHGFVEHQRLLVVLDLFFRLVSIQVEPPGPRK